MSVPDAAEAADVIAVVSVDAEVDAEAEAEVEVEAEVDADADADADAEVDAEAEAEVDADAQAEAEAEAKAQAEAEAEAKAQAEAEAEAKAQAEAEAEAKAQAEAEAEAKAQAEAEAEAKAQAEAEAEANAQAEAEAEAKAQAEAEAEAKAQAEAEAEAKAQAEAEAEAKAEARMYRILCEEVALDTVVGLVSDLLSAAATDVAQQVHADATLHEAIAQDTVDELCVDLDADMAAIADDALAEAALSESLAQDILAETIDELVDEHSSVIMADSVAETGLEPWVVVPTVCEEIDAVAAEAHAEIVAEIETLAAEGSDAVIDEVVAEWLAEFVIDEIAVRVLDELIVPAVLHVQSNELAPEAYDEVDAAIRADAQNSMDLIVEEGLADAIANTAADAYADAVAREAAILEALEETVIAVVDAFCAVDGEQEHHDATVREQACVDAFVEVRDDIIALLAEDTLMYERAKEAAIQAAAVEWIDELGHDIAASAISHQLLDAMPSMAPVLHHKSAFTDAIHAALHDFAQWSDAARAVAHLAATYIPEDNRRAAVEAEARFDTGAAVIVHAPSGSTIHIDPDAARAAIPRLARATEHPPRCTFTDTAVPVDVLRTVVGVALGNDIHAADMGPALADNPMAVARAAAALELDTMLVSALESALATRHATVGAIIDAVSGQAPFAAFLMAKSPRAWRKLLARSRAVNVLDILWYIRTQAVAPSRAAYSDSAGSWSKSYAAAAAAALDLPL